MGAITVARFALIRHPGQDAQLVEETALPLEAELHEALTEHPELVQGEDLGLGRTVVVGWESGLASGYADLVLVDEHGQLCLVEVKKEGNPDTRRVVAQLLDYAANLWGMSLGDFERSVFQPFRTHRLPESAGTFEEYLNDLVPGTAEDGAEGLTKSTRIVSALEETLASGRFALVVVAPGIPAGVQRALEYLNAQGLRLFALEVSYFKGPAEAFVPRVVVRPTAADNAKTRRPPTAPYDRESFLAELPDELASFADSLLDACVEVGGRVTWKQYGPSMETTRGTESRQVASIQPPLIYVTLKPPSGFPVEPFEQARQSLAEIGIGSITEKAVWYSLRLHDADDAALDRIRHVVVRLCSDLTERITWEPLDPALRVAFDRNDFNLWKPQVPALADYEGRPLHGRVRHTGDGAECSLKFMPLAGGQPGWVPRFADGGDQSRVWPHGDTGSYELEISEVGPPS